MFSVTSVVNKDFDKDTIMATTTMPVTLALPRRSLGEWIALFALEAKYEILKYVRLPIFAISTLLFPTMFYVLFGIVLPGGGHGRVRRPQPICWPPWRATA